MRSVPMPRGARSAVETGWGRPDPAPEPDSGGAAPQRRTASFAHAQRAVRWPQQHDAKRASQQGREAAGQCVLVV
jgi:hypothetical protein